MDLPPVPENEAPIEESQVAEEPKQESSEANEVPSDLEVPNTEILPTTDALPTPPAVPEQEIDTELPLPPPPPGENAPSFDPFGDLPANETDAPGLDKPEPVETNVPTSPFDDSPLKNEPVNAGTSDPFSNPNSPPIAPSFDPFADDPASGEVPPPPVPDNPFETPPPPAAPANPFEAPPPPPSFDPFEQPQNEGSQKILLKKFPSVMFLDRLSSEDEELDFPILLKNLPYHLRLIHSITNP